MKNRKQMSVMDDPSAFRQQVRMAAVQVTGLRPEELSVALAYEVEPLSGIPATEAEVEFRPVADADTTVRVFEVAVRRRGKTSKGAGGVARLIKPTIFLGVLLVLLAAADCAWQIYRQQEITRKVAAQAPLDAQLKGVHAQTGTIRREVERLRAARTAAEHAQECVDRERARYPQVLDEVAQTFGTRAVLKELSGNAHAIHLGAIALSPQAAADVLADLSRTLEQRGYKLATGAVTANAQGLTTTFDCEVTHD